MREDRKGEKDIKTVEKRKALEIARNSKAVGLPLEQIAKITGLSVEDITRLLHQ